MLPWQWPLTEYSRPDWPLANGWIIQIIGHSNMKHTWCTLADKCREICVHYAQQLKERGKKDSQLVFNHDCDMALRMEMLCCRIDWHNINGFQRTKPNPTLHPVPLWGICGLGWKFCCMDSGVIWVRYSCPSYLVFFDIFIWPMSHLQPEDNGDVLASSLGADMSSIFIHSLLSISTLALSLWVCEACWH